MSASATASAIIFVLGLFLISTVLGAVVSGATTLQSNTGPAPTFGTTSVSSASVGADQLTQAQQSLQAGEGPAMGSPAASPNHPSARSAPSMTYDAKGGYVVLFGGFSGGYLSDTWTFAGGNWTNITLTHSPPARAGASMAYDAKDGYVVLFGGQNGNGPNGFVDKTWIFSDGKWSYLKTLVHPGARSDASLVYDSADGYLVLFGGYGPDTPLSTLGALDGTWVFESGVWTQLTPVTHPSARWDASATYDAKDGYVLLFGGTRGPSNLKDTWTFVGGVWTQLAPSPSPSRRSGASMTFDTTDSYVVLFGGYSGSRYLGDTWSFVGGVWTQLTPPASPPTRTDASMAFDARDGYALLFGGSGGGTYLSDTWKFAAGSWTLLSSTSAISPPARSYTSMTYDAKDGYVVLFGGRGPSGVLGDMWTFTGGVWTQLFPPSLPPARFGAGLTYDAKDGYVVLFGGYSGSVMLNDTWTFEAGAWTNITTAHSPEARYGLHMTYDAIDGYVVMFGGADGTPNGLPTGQFNDTWSFVGGVWTYVTSTSYPPGSGALTDAAIAYDAADGYVVLNGGASGYGGSCTWTYAGGAWTHLFQSGNHPTPWYGNRLVWDAKDGYLVNVGGRGWYDVTWTFVNGTWTLLNNPGSVPPSLYDSGIAYDAKDGYVMIFGGVSNVDGSTLADTWTFVGGNWTQV